MFLGRGGEIKNIKSIFKKKILKFLKNRNPKKLFIFFWIFFENKYIYDFKLFHLPCIFNEYMNIYFNTKNKRQK